MITIVGGGPSLRNFEWPSLRGKIIAVNYAAIRLPQATVCFFADRPWFERWEVELMCHRGRKVHAWDGSEDHRIDRPWVDTWRYRGGNSGTAAVGLAADLGYKQITLLGFDFLDGDDTGSFHTHEHDTDAPARWRRQHEGLLPELKKKGVTIVTPKRPSPSP